MITVFIYTSFYCEWTLIRIPADTDLKRFTELCQNYEDACGIMGIEAECLMDSGSDSLEDVDMSIIDFEVYQDGGED